MSKKNTLRATLLLFLFTFCGQFVYSQVNIPADGNFHLEHPDIYFSDDVPKFTNKVFYALPNGFGPTANFPVLGVRNQGDGSRYSEREAWYNTSQGGYYPNAFPFTPQSTDEGTVITVSQLVNYRGRRPNSSTYTMYTNYTYNTFTIRTEVPDFLNTEPIKNLCNTQGPINISDYFKSTITGVVFRIDGNITTTINPGSLSLGNHTLTATKSYDNGTYQGSFIFTIIEKPVAVITPSGSTDICEGTGVVLSAPSSPTGQTYTYVWSSGQTSQQITATTSGNYTVTISNGSCSSTSPSISITTKAIPDKYINITGNTNLCDGETTILTAANAKSYLWYKDGVATTITTQSIQITTAGSYTCVLTGENGCSVTTDPTVITVKPNPKPTIVVTGSLTICAGQTVTLTAQSTGNPDAYQWSNGQQGQTIQVSTSGIYSVTATNPGSCNSTSVPVVVDVLPNPKPTITPVGPTSFCVGDGVRLIASPGKSYQWSSGETTQEIFVKTPGTFTVEVENKNGCISNSDPITIVVKQRPNPSVIVEGSLSLCAGQTVKLSSSITGDAYLWYPSGETTQSINVAEAGSYYVQVFKDGCSGNSEMKTVIVNNPVVPTIQNLNGLNTPCYGEIVTLRASSASTYLWSTGETSQAIQVTQGGTYFVTTKDSRGCSAVSQSLTLIYKQQFTPTITANGNTTVCDGDPVLLTATTGKYYLWSNGATTQSITVYAGGSFTCKVTNSEDCTVETPPMQVVVNPRPYPGIVAMGPLSFCQGGSVTLNISNPVGGATYTWSNGQTGQSIVVTTAGLYSVTASYPNGCIASSANIIVNVLPIAKPTISASGPLTFCEGGNVTLTINETGDKYLWSTGATTKSITVSTSGSYTATITNNNNCSLTSAPEVVSVTPAPKPTIGANGPLTVCQGTSVVLNVSNPVAGANYTWSNGQTGQSISVDISGNYSVSAVYPNGCSGVSDLTTIKVLPVSTPTITASGPLTFCDGGAVTLTINETGDSYVWSNGETTKSIVVRTTGTYTGTITNTNGCSLSSQPVPVQVNPVPKPNVVANGPLTFCQGNNVILTVSNPEPGANYTWSNGQSGQSITVTTSGLYSVNANYLNTCSAVSNSTPILVLPIVKPTIIPSGNLNFCEGGSVTLSINETGDSYLWNTGETTKSITVRNSGVYSAKIVNNNGCSQESEGATVFVSPAPKPTVVSSSSLTFCQGLSTILSVSNPQPGAVYTWSNGQTGQSININSSGNYGVTAVYQNGCSSISDASIVNVLPIVTPTITASGPLTFCEGGSVTLTINETGDKYLWSTGETTKSITVTTTGNYTATITNNNGCNLTSIPVNVVSSPRPKPTVTASGPLSFCSGGNVTLTVSNPQPGANYSWSDGQNGQSILVSTSGNYTVTASYQNGCSSISDASVVQVQQIVTPTITAGSTLTFCEGGSVTLTINETGDKYLWSTGETTKSITVSTTGSYTGTIVNNNGCSRISLPVNVVASPRPKPTITASGPLTFCQGGNVTLTVSNPVANAIYTWSNGLSGQSIVASISGSYSVGVVYENGCSEVSSASVVNVLPVVKPTVTASGPLTFCEGGSVILSVNEIGDKYLWSTGETTKSITVSTTGSYTATIQNNNGCSLSSDAISVTALAKIKPIVALSTPSPLCEGEKTTLYVSNPEPGANYTWNNGKTGASIEVAESGNYTVFATYTNSCSTVSDIVPVVFYPIPKPTISADNTSTICEGTPLRLTINENAASYRWSTGETTRSIEVSTSGSYIAYIKNAQGCERASDPTIITVLNNKIAGISVFGKTNMCEGETATLTASQGTSYLWSTGQTTRSIVVSTSGVYNVEITNAAGCKSNSADLRINVYPIPKPTIQIVGSTELCAPNTVTLTIKENGTAYRWSNGATTKSITVGIGGTYTGYISNTQGCERESEPVTVTVRENSIPIITAGSSTTFCEGGKVVLSVPNTIGYTYLWNTGETTNSIEVTKSGDYYVRVKNDLDCERFSANTKVVVFPISKPTIAITGQTEFCQPGAVTLTIKETGNSYRWSNGATTKSIVVSTTGTYTAFIKNAEGCERESDPITITVKPNEVPIITASANTSFCEGKSITLSVPNKLGESYLWSNGETTNTITVNASGDYFVKVKNSEGCESLSAITKVNVFPISKPTITLSGPAEFCQPGTITLTIKETAASYRWSNGATSKSIIVSTSGSYTAYIKNAEGCERESDPVTITVKANEIPVITASGNTTFCEGEKITLSVPNIAGQTYLWNTEETTNSIEVSKSGDYFVRVRNNDGCDRFSEITKVIVNPIPKPTIIITGPTEFCQPGSVILTIKESGKSYRWSTGETTKSITVNNTGSYTAFIINAQGCERESDPVVVTVKDNAIPTVTASSSTTFCEGESVTLSVPNNLGETYLWNNGATTNSIEVGTAGNYFVKVTNSAGCERLSATTKVTVHPISKPTITLSGPAEFCQPGSVTLTIKETAASYRWSNGATTKSITVNASGNFTAYIKNAEGCERESDPVTIIVKANDVPVITASGNTTFCEGDKITLSVPNIAGQTYLWSTEETTNSIEVTKGGDYFVRVKNLEGCERYSAITKVIVNPIPKPTILLSGPTEFCQPGSVTLTIKESGSAYRWSTGETTKNITVNTSGSYSAFIINAQGCERESEPVVVNVKENQIPVITASGSTTFCEGNTITLSVPNILGNTYLWNNGATTNSIEVAASGDYFVKIKNPEGCERLSSTTKVIVHPISKPTITLSGPAEFCQPGSVTLTIKENAVSYRWSTGETTKSIIVKESGTYIGYLKNAEGCERVSEPVEITVKQNTLPVITASAGTTFCEGEKITLSVPNVIGQTYLWNTEETTNSIEVSKGGDYFVKVKNLDGCERYSEITKVTVYPISKPTITLTGLAEFCQPDSVILTITETGSSYRWSNGATTKSITVKESGTFIAYIKNAQGCERISDPVVIKVKPNSIPIISASSSTTFCEGDKITLAVPNRIGFTYLWNTGETTSSIEVSSSGDYYVKVKNSEGCERNSAITKVTVYPIPKPTISLSGSTDFCEPATVTLTIKENATSYRWSNGATTKSIVVSESGSYTGYIKNTQGCERESDPVIVNVKENTLPKITASGNTTFCEGDKITLSVPSVIGQSYLWNTGETTNSIIISTSGDYSVKVRNAAECERISLPVKVVVHPIPKPTIILTGETDFCQPDSVILTIKEDGTAYRWSNGATTKSITVKSSGVFTAFIKNAEGCERASDAVVINVRTNLIPVISASSNTTFCEGENITLSVPNKLGETYLWNTGETTNSIIVSTKGDYFIKVKNSAGCERLSAVMKVIVHPIPKPTIQVTGSTTFCQPDSVTLTIVENGTSYRWSSGQTTKSIVVKVGGIYKAYIKNAEGCERESESITITVKDNPIPFISASSNTTFCEGDKITLSVPDVIGNSYSWNTGATTNSIEVNTSGNYYVRVKNLDGCERQSAITKVTVNPIPKPTITLSGSSEFCQPDSVILTIKENGTTYRWSNGATTKSIVVKESGVFTAYITNPQGCERESEPVTIKVKLNEIPVISASSSTTFCEGEKITLSVPNKIGETYLWNTGETSNVITVSNQGDYFVVVKNNSGCERQSAVTKVIVHAIPKPTIQVTGSTTLCQPDSVILTIVENGTSYRWSSGEKTKSIVVKIGGTYKAFIKNAEGCERESEPITINVRENRIPIVTASSSTTFCEGEKITLSVPNKIGETYSWSTGETSNVITVSSQGDYFVIVKNSLGCERQSAVTKVIVHAIPKPTVQLTGEATFCEGDSVVLTIKEEAAKYRWSTGATTRSITVKTSETIIGYIQNKEGCERATDPIVTTAKANPIPVVTASGKTTICDGETVILTSSLGTTYLWSNGATTRSITVDAPGDYFVTVTNNQGCNRTSLITKVIVLANNTPTIVSSLGNEFCNGYATVLTASEGKFYRWNTGETTRQISVNKSGKYVVTVINENNCSRESAAFEIIVRNPTELKKIVDFETCINGGTINLDSKNSENPLGGTYVGKSVVGNIFNPASAGLGTHKIIYTFKNEFGCISITEFTVTVVDLTVLNIDPDISVCETSGNLLLLNASLPAGVIASGNGVTNNVFIPSEAGLGKHIILYSYTNGSGCKSTATRVIEVVATPTAPVITGRFDGCDGDVLTLTARATVVGNSQLTYLWYKKGISTPFAQGQVISYTLNGSEIIYATARAANVSSCESSLSEIKLTSNNPLGDFSSNVTRTPLAGLVKFTPAVTGAVRYSWDFGDGGKSTDENAVHYYYKAGKYTVTLIAYSSQGCPLAIAKKDMITVDPDNIIITPPGNDSNPAIQDKDAIKTIIYPNPIKDGVSKIRIFSKNKGSQKATVQIYTLGQRLISTQVYDVEPGQNDIDLKDLNLLTGGKTYYLFTVKVNNDQQTIKVLVL